MSIRIYINIQLGIGRRTHELHIKCGKQALYISKYHILTRFHLREWWNLCERYFEWMGDAIVHATADPSDGDGFWFERATGRQCHEPLGSRVRIFLGSDLEPIPVEGDNYPGSNIPLAPKLFHLTNKREKRNGLVSGLRGSRYGPGFVKQGAWDVRGGENIQGLAGPIAARPDSMVSCSRGISLFRENLSGRVIRCVLALHLPTVVYVGPTKDRRPFREIKRPRKATWTPVIVIGGAGEGGGHAEEAVPWMWLLLTVEQSVHFRG